MKKAVKSFVSLLLVFVMIFGIIPISEEFDLNSLFAQKASAANAISKKYKGVCLADLECTDEGHYTGNMGDSRVYKLDATTFKGYAPYGDTGTALKRNGNIGVNGQKYTDGFEVWIARWNFGDNISWAYRTFKLDGKYNTLSGSTGLIKSYNTTHFDTTAYFYGDGKLLHSIRMKQNDYTFNFTIDVSGIDELKVMIKDNTEEAGGTSFALYDLYLYKEEYNVIKNFIDKCIVTINIVDEYGYLVDNANIELYVGGDYIKTVYAPNGKYVGVFDDWVSKVPRFQVDTALYMITARAYVSLGNEMYLISDYGLPKTHLSSSTSICIPSNKVQFCPELTVAYNNSNCSEKKINKLLENTRKNYFNLTGGKVDIYFNNPIPYSSDEQIYWTDSNGNESGVAADIRIRNNSSICNASIDGYWEGNGTSSINIDTGFTYYGSQKLDSQTLCHELTHYLFGAWDEYCTGHGGIRVNNGTATNENLYWYDVNDNGIIEDSETHASYWGHAFPRPTNSKGKAIDFGLMDGNNKLNISTYETYSYLEQERYGGSRGANASHPEWYTFQYMVFEESVEETVERVLRKKSGVSTYTYSVSAVDASLNAGNLIQVDRGELEITDATVTNETLEAVLALKQTTSPVCNYTFEDNGNTINLNFTETESSSITVVAVDFENNCISTDVDGVANVSIADNIKTIYICNEGAYNKISVGYIKTNCETPTEITYSGENDCVFAIYKNGIDYTYGDSLIGIANPFSIFAQDEVTQTGTLQQIISRNQNVDFNTVKCVYNDGISIQEIEVTMSEGEHQTLICSFDYLGDGEYCLVAETAKSIVYEAIPVVSFEHVDSVYEKELTITIDESYDYSNVFSYVLYCSETPITSENTDLVAYETFVPGFTDYTFYMFNEDFGKYYFAIQAVGIDGGKSELTIIDGIDVVEKDSDSDGLPDKWISIYSAIADLEDIPGTDSDDDGFTNLQEYEHGTNPLNPDTDGDNVYDSIELWNDLNPLEPMTDGVTDDYTIIYGTPDVSIDASSFVVGETDVTCSIENNTDGKAMRTLIYLYVGDELVDAGTVNLDSNSSVEYSFSKEYLVDGMRIVLDEGQITRDTDYSNNEFIYKAATGISAENSEVTVLKNTETQLEYVIMPDTASDILAWTSSDEEVISVNHRGIITAKTIGRATVTAITPSGYSCIYNILVEPFPGAGETEFDCRLINDNTGLEIIGYYGNDTNVIIPDLIGGYPVTSIADGAFDGCTFESISINSGVKNIDLSAFNGASNLKSIGVSKDNTFYSSVDGVLYNIDQASLIRYPSANENTTFTIPDTVATIDINAFNGAVALTTVDIPESVTTIKSSSFTNAALTNINFAGSQRKWNTLTIASDSGVSGVTVYYGKFTASFISEGETVSQIDYKPGETITIPDDIPDKKYYSFADWTPDVPETMPEYDVDFTAVWELSNATRTVEYYVDGELYWSDYRYEGETVNTPETVPTKEGYTFVKWSPDVAETMPDENLTYEAIWDINIHQVSFVVDGEDYHSYECAYLDTLTTPDSPTKEGYVFAGWTPAIPESMPDMDMTFTAVFNPITYTATFMNGDEVIGTDEFIVSDEVLDYPATEPKEYYTWVWEDYEIVADNIIVNGEYVPIIYTASFVADGVTVEDVKFSVENQSAVAPEIPQKAGYTATWESYEITLADFTVNAVYTPIVYTATFTHKGEVVGTDEFTVEDTSLDYPVIDTKVYYYWSWDEHKIIADNITVNGEYVPITYTIKYVSNGKTVKTQSFNVETVDTITPPSFSLPNKTGYKSEWEDWEGKICNLTVNEIYVPIVYSARFWCNGNLIRTSKFTVENKKTDFTMPYLPNREGYKVVWQDFEVIPNDIDIYGEYVPIEYTATFIADGVVVSTQTFTVETESLDEPPVPQKPGYYARWSNYEIKAKDITIVAKYHFPEVVVVSKRTLDVGDTFRLLPTCNFEVTEKSWVSSDTSVATVNQHGKVTAVGEGECKITVTCYGKDSLGNYIHASKSTKIVVNDNSENNTSKRSFRDLFDEFFEVTLHDLVYNLREFLLVLLRYAY